jgi:AcrR family transcriptional regulator
VAHRTPRERRILDVTAMAFHEKGFHGVGVDEIGRRAGLSGPALYRHFGGKDELLATLLDEAMDELLGATDPVLDDPTQDLWRALRHHVAFAVEHRQLVSLYHRESRFLVDPWAAAFARREGRYVRSWEALVGGALPATSPDDLAATTQAVLGLVFSVSAWPQRALRAGAVEDLLLRLIADGLHGLG